MERHAAACANGFKSAIFGARISAAARNAHVFAVILFLTAFAAARLSARNIEVAALRASRQGAAADGARRQRCERRGAGRHRHHRDGPGLGQCPLRPRMATDGRVLARSLPARRRRPLCCFGLSSALHEDSDGSASGAVATCVVASGDAWSVCERVVAHTAWW